MDTKAIKLTICFKGNKLVFRGSGVYSIKLPETSEFSESDKVKIRSKYCVRGSRVVIKKNNKKVHTWVRVLNRKITVKRLRNILLDN